MLFLSKEILQLMLMHHYTLFQYAPEEGLPDTLRYRDKLLATTLSLHYKKTPTLSGFLHGSGGGASRYAALSG